MGYEAMYAIAEEELDACFESEGITRGYFAWCHGVTDYQFDMIVGRMVDAAVKAMRDTAYEYKDGLSEEGRTA